MPSFISQNPSSWLKEPLIISAPLKLISGPDLAVAVSRAGGLGFIGVGDDCSNLSKNLQETQALLTASPIPNTPSGILPIGLGFISWSADLDSFVKKLTEFEQKPYAVWLFAPKSLDELATWVQKINEATNKKTQVWVQIGSVASALAVMEFCKPDVLVVQGFDAGGHGLTKSASLMTLLPEVRDALDAAGLRHIALAAAGGIVDGRGGAAARMLGANGIALGTRFLASPEAQISQGYKNAIIAATDGGVSTVRTSLYDNLRGPNGWPAEYNGRGVSNKSFRDWEGGMPDEQNKRLYTEAMKLGDDGWGSEQGRMTTYAGSGVGLVKGIISAGEIVQEVREKVISLIGEEHLILAESRV